MSESTFEHVRVQCRSSSRTSVRSWILIQVHLCSRNRWTYRSCYWCRRSSSEKNLPSVSIQTRKLLPSPSAQYQSWELEQLNVVQLQFLEQQNLTGSSLPVWSQSRVFVGLNTHFPLLSWSCVPQKNEETQFTNYFISTH